MKRVRGAPAAEPGSPIERRLRAGGVEQAFFEWNPTSRGLGPSIVMAHATGFHARCWDETIRRLVGRESGRRPHVIAVDMRGHGRSPRREAIESWRVFGEDLAALIDALGLESILGVGHSMGGHAMTHAAALVPKRFSSLLLFDPVILPPEIYAAAQAAPPPSEHPTARRREAFDSPEAMIERFADRLPYARFDRRVLADYCRHGLLPAASVDPHGGGGVEDEGEAAGFRLACAPATESSVYVTTTEHAAILDHVRAVRVPVLVVRAQTAPGRALFDFAYSPTWPELANAFADAEDRHFSRATHFLPFEDPDVMAELLEEMIKPALRP